MNLVIHENGPLPVFFVSWPFFDTFAYDVISGNVNVNAVVKSRSRNANKIRGIIVADFYGWMVNAT